MRADRHVRVVPFLGGDDPVETAFDVEDTQRDELVAATRTAIFNARNFLLSEQQADGHFSGRVDGPGLPESEFVLLTAFLGTETSDKAQQAAEYVRSQQLPDGGWAAFHGGGVDVSTSVRAYFALKLTGSDPNAEEMRRACRAIHAAGGIEAVDEVTNLYLALLGQVSYEAGREWSACGSIGIPLSIVRAVKPCRRVSPEVGIRELLISTLADATTFETEEMDRSAPPRTMGIVRRTRGAVWSWCKRHGRRTQDKRAIEQTERLVLARLFAPVSTSLGFREALWSIIALKCLGHKDDSAAMTQAQTRLDEYLYTEDDRLRVEPMKTPVLDTAIALAALSASGVDPADGAVCRAAGWLLAQRLPDAASQTTRGLSKAVGVPIGWNSDMSEVRRADAGVTARVAKVLRTSLEPVSTGSDALPPVLNVVSQSDENQCADEERWIAILGETIDALSWTESWLLGTQQEDGRWGPARLHRPDKRRGVLPMTWMKSRQPIQRDQVNAVEQTAHVLSALGCLGRRIGEGPMNRAVAWLRGRQRADGSWRGTGSASALRDTATVLAGLAETGLSSDDGAIVVAVNWLLVHQQSSGGWGDQVGGKHRAGSPDLDSATVTHTAWAVLGLLAAGRHDHPAVEGGIRFLLDRQLPEGTWNEPDFTDRASGRSSAKTGQDRVRRRLLPVCTALMALAAWTKTRHQDAVETSDIDKPVAVTVCT